MPGKVKSNAEPVIAYLALIAAEAAPAIVRSMRARKHAPANGK